MGFPVHFSAMLSSRFTGLLRLLLILPFSLMAQDPEEEGLLLPDTSEPPPVDLIRPVPVPVFELGESETEIEMPKDLIIDNGGGSIEGNTNTGVRYGGPVHVTGDNGLEIFSNTALLDTVKKTVTFIGDVTVYQGDIFKRGQKAVYFYETRFLDDRDMRVSMDPMLLDSNKFTAEKDGNKTIYVAENANLTTHDMEDPNYWIRSSKMTVYPGEKITFKNLKIYAGEIPVFWLPYLSQPLDSVLGYHFLVGARSAWGPFILNSYGIMLGGKRNPETGEREGDWLLSQWRLDIRGRRGVAVGVDLEDVRRREKGISKLSLYYLNDWNYEETTNGFDRFEVDANRYKIAFEDRLRLDFEEDVDWRLDTDLTLLSDQYYLDDFEPQEFTTNPSPDNTLGLYRKTDKSLLSVFGRFEMNDFYRTDTQSPEVALDQARRPIFGTQFLHEGQTSFSVRGESAADAIRDNLIDPLLDLPVGSDGETELLLQLSAYEQALVQQIRNLDPSDPQYERLRTQLLDTGFQRFHTNHTISRPFNYSDWATFTPRVGGAFTHYSAVQGPAESDSRVLVHGGAEAALKFSKNYGGVKNHDLGIDGLLHVIRPYVNWSVLASDDLSENFPNIDRLTDTTRPRSLDPSRFTAIDEFNSWNILRFGTRNHLITRRDDQSHEWLYVDTYIDAFFDDPEGERSWSNLYNDITWKPVPWMALDLETQVPVAGDGSGFSELTSRLRFMPTENLEIGLAYRHLNNNEQLNDSERIELNTYLRLSENWGVSTFHIFEATDGVMELQRYTLHHDFGNWVVGLGISHTDTRSSDEFGIVFSLSLKDLPYASLPVQLDAPSSDSE